MTVLKLGPIVAAALVASAVTPTLAAPDGSLTPRGAGASLLGFAQLNLTGKDLKDIAELNGDAVGAKMRFASGGGFGGGTCACGGGGTSGGGGTGGSGGFGGTGGFGGSSGSGG